MKNSTKTALLCGLCLSGLVSVSWGYNPPPCSPGGYGPGDYVCCNSSEASVDSRDATVLNITAGQTGKAQCASRHNPAWAWRYKSNRAICNGSAGFRCVQQ